MSELIQYLCRFLIRRRKYLCRLLIRRQKLTAQSSNYGQKSGAKTNSSTIFELCSRRSEQLQDEVKGRSSKVQDLANLGHSSMKSHLHTPSRRNQYIFFMQYYLETEGQPRIIPLRQPGDWTGGAEDFAMPPT